MQTILRAGGWNASRRASKVQTVEKVDKAQKGGPNAEGSKQSVKSPAEKENTAGEQRVDNASEASWGSEPILLIPFFKS